MIGLEDYVGGRNHTITVRCSSTEGALYVITGAELEQRMMKDERTWNSLLDLAIERDQTIIGKIKN